MQVKTLTTSADVNEINFGNNSSQSTAHFYWIKNLGDSTLYVSANPDPIAEKDDVAELPAKGAVSVETDEGKIYILGAGKVEIHRTNSKFCPFELAASDSGGGGGSTGESQIVFSKLVDFPAVGNNSKIYIDVEASKSYIFINGGYQLLGDGYSTTDWE